MMNLKQRATFCRRMGIGLKAGVDILRLLENEAKSGSTKHRSSLQGVHDEIRRGNTFAKALFQHRDYFPPLLIQLVNASEVGGRMDSMFHYMADYYDDLKKTRSYFISQITWPVIQLIMAVGIIGLVILLQGILSANSSYDASGVGLRGMAGFITYCAVVGTVAGVVGITAYGLWKNWFQCHRILVPVIQHIPILGTALTTLGLSRLSMTLSIMLNAGVDAKKSLKQAFYATGNFYFIGGVDEAVAAVGRGESFGDAFEKCGVLPNEFIETVRIGEMSGTETESLDNLAQQYQERSKEALKAVAGIASFTIWLLILLLMAFMIIRMAMQYINTINSFLP